MLEICDSDNRRDIIGTEMDTEKINDDFDEDFDLMMGKTSTSHNKPEDDDTDDEFSDESSNIDNTEDFSDDETMDVSACESGSESEAENSMSEDEEVSDGPEEELDTHQENSSKNEDKMVQDIYGRLRHADGSVVQEKVCWIILHKCLIKFTWFLLNFYSILECFQQICATRSACSWYWLHSPSIEAANKGSHQSAGREQHAQYIQPNRSVIQRQQSPRHERNPSIDHVRESDCFHAVPRASAAGTRAIGDDSTRQRWLGSGRLLPAVGCAEILHHPIRIRW